MKDRGNKMGEISLQAHAKLNLTLDIAGRREDGYHLLQSVMQSVSLADSIRLRLLSENEGISITADTPLLPTDARNICWQAASAFLQQIGSTRGVSIKIKKRIPLAAGLGGGSSDAAAVLHGLNTLFSSGLDLFQLQALGLTVGADVPFCLQGGTAFVEGIGEKVTSLCHFPEAVFILIKPKANISTAEVYRKFAPKHYGGYFSREFLKLLAAKSRLDVLSTACGNILETATIPNVPEIEVWKERLVQGGAHTALMSGSGPTVFGIFGNEEKANQFCRHWQDRVELYLARPVQSGVLVS